MPLGNLGQFRIKDYIEYNNLSVPFALTYHFPDLQHIHENVQQQWAFTALPHVYKQYNKYNHLQIKTILYHKESHVLGLIRQLDVKQYTNQQIIGS